MRRQLKCKKKQGSCLARWDLRYRGAANEVIQALPYLYALHERKPVVLFWVQVRCTVDQTVELAFCLAVLARNVALSVLRANVPVSVTQMRLPGLDLAEEN